MKSSSDVLINRLGLVEERMSELESIPMETSKTKKKKEKTLKKQNRISKNCGTTTKGVNM